MTVIDAHQHVWDLDRVDYPWLTAEAGPILYRTYAFDELEPTLRECGVDGTVMVQSADSEEETRWMQAVADRHPMVKAIVGWVPLDDVRTASTLLDTYAGDQRIVGIRHLIHTEPDEDWLLRPEIAEGLALLADRGYTFDLVAVTPRHLSHVDRIAKRHPDLRIVVDHLAKPPIQEGLLEPWRTQMATAASNPNVYAKVSGLNTAADPERWTPDDLAPYVTAALEMFGAQRLMYGGDWPITLLAGGYRKVWDATLELVGGLTEAERDAILGETAINFYRLDTGTSDD